MMLLMNKLQRRSIFFFPPFDQLLDLTNIILWKWFCVIYSKTIVCVTGVTEFSHWYLQVFWPLTESKNYFLHCLHVCFSLSTTEKELFRRLNLHEPRNVTRKERQEKRDYWEKEREVRPNFKRNGAIGSKKKKALPLEENAKGRRKKRTRHDCIQIVKRNRLVAFERMILHER